MGLCIMNQLTKQEMQVALQQMTNSILDKTASRQDIINASLGIKQFQCHKQDIQLLLDNLKDKLLEHIVPVNNYQLQFDREILNQLDLISRHLEIIESKITSVLQKQQDMQSQPNKVTKDSNSKFDQYYH